MGLQYNYREEECRGSKLEIKWHFFKYTTKNIHQIVHKNQETKHTHTQCSYNGKFQLLGSSIFSLSPAKSEGTKQCVMEFMDGALTFTFRSNNCDIKLLASKLTSILQATSKLIKIEKNN